MLVYTKTCFKYLQYNANVAVVNRVCVCVCVWGGGGGGGVPVDSLQFKRAFHFSAAD